MRKHNIYTTRFNEKIDAYLKTGKLEQYDFATAVRVLSSLFDASLLEPDLFVSTLDRLTTEPLPDGLDAINQIIYLSSAFNVVVPSQLLKFFDMLSKKDFAVLGVSQLVAIFSRYCAFIRAIAVRSVYFNKDINLPALQEAEETVRLLTISIESKAQFDDCVRLLNVFNEFRQRAVEEIVNQRSIKKLDGLLNFFFAFQPYGFDRRTLDYVATVLVSRSILYKITTNDLENIVHAFIAYEYLRADVFQAVIELIDQRELQDQLDPRIASVFQAVKDRLPPGDYGSGELKDILEDFDYDTLLGVVADAKERYSYVSQNTFL